MDSQYRRQSEEEKSCHTPLAKINEVDSHFFTEEDKSIHGIKQHKFGDENHQLLNLPSTFARTNYDTTYNLPGNYENSFQKTSSYENPFQKTSSYENPFKKTMNYENTYNLPTSFQNTFQNTMSYETGYNLPKSYENTPQRHYECHTPSHTQN